MNRSLLVVVQKKNSQYFRNISGRCVRLYRIVAHSTQLNDARPKDLEDQELQLHGIQNRIVRGTQAEQELQHVHKFNELYRSAYKMHINAPRIRELSDLASEIEFRMCSLEEKIWSCEINVDPTCRAPEFVSQAQHDAEKYFSQYRELEQRLFEIKNKLKELQK